MLKLLGIDPSFLVSLFSLLKRLEPVVALINSTSTVSF